MSVWYSPLTNMLLLLDRFSSLGTCIGFCKYLRWKWLCKLQIRGVFKKRPNFLNSAPTSIESALQLQSAPSVRFWQQTAIRSVSLWALVVEHHPLNWARAQAIRRIGDTVTVKELEEQRVCVCEILLQTW